MDDQKIADILQRLAPGEMPPNECASDPNCLESEKSDLNLINSVDANSKKSIEHTSDEIFTLGGPLAKASIACERTFDLKKEDELARLNGFVEEPNELIEFMRNLKFKNDDEVNNNIDLRCSTHTKMPSRSYSQYFIKKPSASTCTLLQSTSGSESSSTSEESDGGFSTPSFLFMESTPDITKEECVEVKEQEEDLTQNKTATVMLKVQSVAETNDFFNIDCDSETIPKKTRGDTLQKSQTNASKPRVKNPDNTNNKNNKRTKVNTLPGMGVIIQDSDYF